MTATPKRLTTAITAAILVLFCAAAYAQVTDEQVHKDEMGLSRMQVIYPPAGATIEEDQPMIGADSSSLETPVDPESVRVFLNGADVSDSAEITPSYVIYEPPGPLAPGLYEVRITAENIDNEAIEPLTWTFSILGEEAPAAVDQRDNTTGRLVVSTDYVDASYTPRSSISVNDIFREKEGMKLNADLTFTNISEGRTISGSYHRETQYYTDVELDKARLDYRDEEFDATLGHFWLKLSELTLLGAELMGARAFRRDDEWALTLFSGRTQDPSTSGDFWQLASGLQGSYDWNAAHRTYLTALSAYEKTGATGVTANPPARDEIVSILHQYRYSPLITATFEAAANNRRENNDDPADHDSAMRFALTGSRNAVTGELEAYRIEENFLPVAEGSSKYLNSDREGFRARGSWRAAEFVDIGGEYEQYDTFSEEKTTKRGNAYIALISRDVGTLRYRYSKLTSGGTLSETDAVTGMLLIPATAIFAEGRLTAGWQNIQYDSASTLTDTTIKMLSLNSSFKDILAFSVSYSESETDNMTTLTTSESSNFALGLNWSVIPFKLLWNGRYELVESSGSTSDNEEQRIKTGIKYILDDTYAFNLKWENIDYDDAAAPAFNYTQNIVRTGVEWDF